MVSRARELLEEMEKAHGTGIRTASEDVPEQMSFGAVNRESALAMLEKTNIDELTDAECRELLKDMLSVMG